MLRRNARDGSHYLLHILRLDQLLAFAGGLQALVGTGFVDHIDGLVGHEPIVDVAPGELRSRPQRIVAVAQVMVLLEARFESLEDAIGGFHIRFVHVDLLEAARQGAVLLENTPVFLIRGGTHAPQVTRGEHGLEQIRGIHHPA